MPKVRKTQNNDRQGNLKKKRRWKLCVAPSTVRFKMVNDTSRKPQKEKKKRHLGGKGLARMRREGQEY